MNDAFNSDVASFEERIRSSILITLYDLTETSNALKWEATPHNSFVAYRRGVSFELSELYDYEAACCHGSHLVIKLRDIHGETAFSICSGNITYEANRMRSMFSELKNNLEYKDCSSGPGVINHTLWHTYQTLVS